MTLFRQSMVARAPEFFNPIFASLLQLKQSSQSGSAHDDDTKTMTVTPWESIEGDFRSFLECSGITAEAFNSSTITEKASARSEFDKQQQQQLFDIEKRKGRQAKTLADGIPPLLQVIKFPPPPSVPNPEDHLPVIFTKTILG